MAHRDMIHTLSYGLAYTLLAQNRQPLVRGRKGLGEPMGVIVREEYVCDFCDKAIGDTDALVGRLSLRKAGARGLGRNLDVALHADCSVKLTQFATPVSIPRKAAQKA